MRFRLAWGSIGVLYLLLPAAWGEEAQATGEEQDRIARLVAQLGAEDFAAREAAELALLKVRGKAKPALEAASRHLDPEVRLRATRLAGRVEDAEFNAQWLANIQGAWPEGLKEGKLVGPLLGAADPSNPPPPLEETEERVPPEEGRDPVLEWLSQRQDPSGRWDSRGHGAQVNADLEQTALAVLAFLGAGHTQKVGKYKQRVRAGVDWLIRQQNPQGGFLRAEGTQVDGVAHALAGLALAEASGMGRVPETKAAAQLALYYAAGQHQSLKEDKPYGFGRTARSEHPDLFTTTLFVMQFKSAKVAGLAVKPESFQGMLDFLDAVDRTTEHQFSFVPSGKPSAQATFFGCLARQFLGWKKEDLAPYVEQARKTLPTPQVVSPESDLMTNWMGTLACFQQGGDTWKEWNEGLKKETIDNLLNGRATPHGLWSGAGRVFATSLNRICLEFCRYSPPYKE
ncbi:MAG: hypothetical protein M5U26_19980 [Planctomycetota bacterium]|nr:hypothetical protein [Planctomycetota bacterium]